MKRRCPRCGGEVEIEGIWKGLLVQHCKVCGRGWQSFIEPEFLIPVLRAVYFLRKILLFLKKRLDFLSRAKSSQRNLKEEVNKKGA